MIILQSSNPTPRIRAILIEDQNLVAEGIVAVLGQIAGVEMARVFPSASAALAEEALLRDVQLALVDFHLGKKEEEPRLRELRERFPSIRWIWLSGAVSTASLMQIDALHFHGFVHKDDSSAHLLDAVRAVMDGRPYQSPTARALLEEIARSPLSVPKLLSVREQELLSLIGQGLTNEDIAAVLGLSASTVQTHRRNIMGKLGLHTSVALQAYAQQGGFADAPPPAKS